MAGPCPDEQREVSNERTCVVSDPSVFIRNVHKVIVEWGLQIFESLREYFPSSCLCQLFMGFCMCGGTVHVPCGVLRLIMLGFILNGISALFTDAGALS